MQGNASSYMVEMARVGSVSPYTEMPYAGMFYCVPTLQKELVNLCLS